MIPDAAWLAAAVGAGVLLDAVRLRRRIVGLRRVPPVTGRREPLRWAADGAEEAVAGPCGPYELVTAETTVLGRRARRAAFAHARAHGLQVLDLIPADLPVRRALDFARRFDPGRYRTDPFAAGCGVGFATVVSADVLERAGLRPGPLEAGEYGDATARLRRFARPCRRGRRFAADVAVVPAHTSPRVHACATRRAWLRGLDVPLRVALGGSMLGYAAVWLALVADATWGAAAVAAYCLAPYVIFARTPLTPRDLHWAVLLRLVLTPWEWWRTLRAPVTAWERERIDREARARARARDRYRDELTEGLERFFDPPRADCPWCGGWSLRRHLTSRDVVQAKPGRFTLDRCADCGHIFQNPRLNQEGLEFYNRDACDGLGADTAARLFAMQEAVHRARAELAAVHLGPRTWLDVGAGHGHFCRTARTVLPETAFDGLDLGEGVEEAARQGWLRRAYRGRLPDLVDDLTGRYDIVSMHHHLEHTPDPCAELDAAVKILAPGGHLLVEMPDPECRTARLLGRRWGAWMQPRHLHMIPIANLERALAARGMHVVARERRSAHRPHDLAFSVLAALTALAPDPSRPWAPPGGGDRLTRFARRARRVTGLVCAAPLLALALLLDRLPPPPVAGTSNAYRLLARKDEG